MSALFRTDMLSSQHSQTYHAFTCTRLIPHELHTIPFLIVWNGQQFLPEAVRPRYHVLSIPKIDRLPPADHTIPYRYNKISFSHASSQTCLRNRKTVFFLAPLYTYTLLQGRGSSEELHWWNGCHRPDPASFRSGSISTFARPVATAHLSTSYLRC